MRGLSLGGNRLSRPIPTNLGRLSSTLYWLDLSGNFFTGTVRSELGQLTQLDHLDLSSSDSFGSLAKFPTELGRLSQLTYLNLNIRASMTGSIPTEIGYLTHLESLSFGVLHGAVPTELGLLSLLKDLYLYMQSVTGHFPADVFQFPLLESFELIYGENGTIPDEVGLLSRLTDFKVWGATGTIPTTLGQLVLFESLVVGYSNLNGTIPTKLGLLTDLTNLDLSL